MARRNNPGDWTGLAITGGVALAIYLWSKSQEPSLPDTSGGNLAWNALVNASTGKMSAAQVEQLNSQLGQAVIQAGGTPQDEQSAVNEQNAYIQNHPPSTPTFADDINSIWVAAIGPDWFNALLAAQQAGVMAVENFLP